MHRIDVPSATVDHLFTEGSPTGGVPATTVSADWLNDLQENIMAVLSAAGVSPTKGRAQDLVDAISNVAVGRLFNVRVITNTGTYIPSSGMRSVVVEAVGGGGGSAYVPATSVGQWVSTGGAQAGFYARARYTADQIGASVACTIGDAGAGGNAAGTVASTSGGTTSFGGLLSVSGGARSVAGALSSTSTTTLSVPGSQNLTITGTGIVSHVHGQAGSWGVSNSGGDQLGGSGGSSPLGGGGVGSGNVVTTNPATGYGGGGGGGCNSASTASKAGANGSKGVIIIWEFA